MVCFVTLNEDPGSNFGLHCSWIVVLNFWFAKHLNQTCKNMTTQSSVQIHTFHWTWVLQRGPRWDTLRLFKNMVSLQKACSEETLRTPFFFHQMFTGTLSLHVWFLAGLSALRSATWYYTPADGYHLTPQPLSSPENRSENIAHIRDRGCWSSAGAAAGRLPLVCSAVQRDNTGALPSKL